MYFHVFLTVDARLERLVAIGAHKRPFTAVRDQVPLHAALCGEFRVAYRAAVRSRVFVRMLVRFENAVGCKSPAKVYQESNSM